MPYSNHSQGGSVTSGLLFCDDLLLGTLSIIEYQWGGNPGLIQQNVKKTRRGGYVELMFMFNISVLFLNTGHHRPEGPAFDSELELA